MLSSSPTYEEIPQAGSLSDLEDAQLEPSHNMSKGRFLYWRTLALTGLAISVISLGTLLANNVHPVDSPTPAPTSIWRHCGKSIAEAKALDCDFEVLSGAWMPKQCQDPELNEEFRAMGWHYWADADRQVEIPEAELAEREGNEMVYYATQLWHVTHCAYQWRKMHRAWKIGRPVEVGEHALGDWNHTIHCGSLYTDGIPMDMVNTRINVEFFGCG